MYSYITNYYNIILDEPNDKVAYVNIFPQAGDILFFQYGHALSIYILIIIDN